MNTRTIVTVIAAALFSVSLVPMSSAQGSNRAIPEGIEVITITGKMQDEIEVITITGKRPAATVATICAEIMAAGRDTAVEQHNGASSISTEVLNASRNTISSARQAHRRCNEQAATPFNVQI